MQESSFPPPLHAALILQARYDNWYEIQPVLTEALPGLLPPPDLPCSIPDQRYSVATSKSRCSLPVNVFDGGLRGVGELGTETIQTIRERRLAPAIEGT